MLESVARAEDMQNEPGGGTPFVSKYHGTTFTKVTITTYHILSYRLMGFFYAVSG